MRSYKKHTIRGTISDPEIAECLSLVGLHDAYTDPDVELVVELGGEPRHGKGYTVIPVLAITVGGDDDGVLVTSKYLGGDLRLDVDPGKAVTIQSELRVTESAADHTTSEGAPTSTDAT